MGCRWYLTTAPQAMSTAYCSPTPSHSNWQLALRMVPTAAGPRMRAMPPRIEVSDLLEGGPRRGSGAGHETPEGDEYWPDELLCGTAGNASRRAGAAGGADGGGGAGGSGGGLPGLVPRGTTPRSGKAEEDMWPDELLCGTGRGAAGASSQPASHAQEVPKEEEAWPSFFSLLRGTLSRRDSCKSGGVAFASVAASAARSKDGSF